MEYVFLNNHFIAKDKASVGIEDRGYQFGDGVYEVIGVYKNNLFKLEEHLIRLFESAKGIKLNIEYTTEELKNIILNLTEKNNLESGLIYIQVTRGNANRTHSFPMSENHTLVAYTMSQERPAAEVYNEGVSTILTEDVRWLQCNIKTINLLPNALAKQKAIENNAFEAILYRNDSTITEGSSTNLFAVKNDTVYTHPANNLILNGITRRTIINICKELNFELKETAFTKDFLMNADEAFISGTYIDIIPVKNIINKNIEFPTERNITLKLMEELEKLTLFKYL